MTRREDAPGPKGLTPEEMGMSERETQCPICGERPDYDAYEHIADVHDALELSRFALQQADTIQSLTEERDGLRTALERITALDPDPVSYEQGWDMAHSARRVARQALSHSETKE